MDLIKTIEESQKKPGAECFKVGDTVKVHFEIIEGKTKRVQIYEGLVICIKNSGVRKTFTVRKESFGVGVERVFPVNSPRILKIEIVRPGKIGRSKIYYVREKIGKDAKIKEDIGPKARARVENARNLYAAADKVEKEIREAAEKAEQEKKAEKK